MSDAQRTIRVVKELKKPGLRFRIDDFGTGHSSSLSYLRRFPMDTLKIDRSFVSNLDSDPEKREIARTIAGLARNLGMDVVAEGTQALVEVNYLKSLDGEFAQGYYFSRPVDAKQASALVSEHRVFDLEPSAISRAWKICAESENDHSSQNRGRLHYNGSYRREWRRCDLRGKRGGPWHGKFAASH